MHIVGIADFAAHLCVSNVGKFPFVIGVFENGSLVVLPAVFRYTEYTVAAINKVNVVIAHIIDIRSAKRCALVGKGFVVANVERGHYHIGIVGAFFHE